MQADWVAEIRFSASKPWLSGQLVGRLSYNPGKYQRHDILPEGMQYLGMHIP